MPVPISLTVNGKTVAANIDPRTLLVDFLRNDLALTGTHVGCDTGQCGACTVHLNGRAVKACTILALQAQGANVLTIEGLAAADGTLHPMQAAFKECHGLQCGFCTPGMLIAARDIVRRLIVAKIPLEGASDHGVSEALYLRDPDDNGVELYWDRPKEKWPKKPDGSLQMFTHPLDLHDLLAELDRAQA